MAAMEQPASGTSTWYRCQRDIVFHAPDGDDLALDLYLPAEPGPRPPLVIYIHGGSWRSHGRQDVIEEALPLGEEFAVASISYRFSTVAPFPAQLHDCKSAVRWLRAHADELGYDADRIGVIGSSAGGHLALLLALTADRPGLEGDGPHREQSSGVDAVVAYCPPTDFPAVGDLYERRPGKKPDPPGREPIRMLLGGTVEDKPDLARLASPVYHAHAGAPPCLLFHGTDDRLVPFDQSVRMADALRAVDVPVDLIPVDGADHHSAFSDAPAATWAFLHRHLLTPSRSASGNGTLPEPQAGA
jgi:acetyl esterase/lipase